MIIVASSALALYMNEPQNDFSLICDEKVVWGLGSVPPVEIVCLEGGGRGWLCL